MKKVLGIIVLSIISGITSYYTERFLEEIEIKKELKRIKDDGILEAAKV